MLKLAISGMTCNHCVRTVAATLAKVPGVTRVAEVSLDRREAIVEGTPDLAVLVAALADEGFEARASS